MSTKICSIYLHHLSSLCSVELQSFWLTGKGELSQSLLADHLIPPGESLGMNAWLQLTPQLRSMRQICDGALVRRFLIHLQVTDEIAVGVIVQQVQVLHMEEARRYALLIKSYHMLIFIILKRPMHFRHTPHNQDVLNRLMENPAIQRLSSFANGMSLIFAKLLYIILR